MCVHGDQGSTLGIIYLVFENSSCWPELTDYGRSSGDSPVSASPVLRLQAYLLFSYGYWGQTQVLRLKLQTLDALSHFPIPKSQVLNVSIY